MAGALASTPVPWGHGVGVGLQILQTRKVPGHQPFLTARTPCWISQGWGYNLTGLLRYAYFGSRECCFCKDKGRTRYPSGNFSMAVLIFSNSAFSLRSGGGVGQTQQLEKNSKQASKWLPWWKVFERRLGGREMPLLPPSSHPVPPLIVAAPWPT